ncbi:hypothetical protein [Streptomyces sp. NPDC053427]|uniref:hypothetical protein n=1 Tax=Streptomyces sp. NPDC053427 TaxID=3365701 RepID=UPI0037D5ECD9
MHRYETHRNEGTTVAEACFFVALTAGPATGVFAIGLRSSVLGAAALLLLGTCVISMVALIERDRRKTPRLTSAHGGWQQRLSRQPDVAALLQQGWWLKGDRPEHRQGPGGP